MKLEQETQVEKNCDNDIWNAMIECAGETFHTTGRGRTPGKPFTYSIRGGEMFISTKAKSITKATVRRTRGDGSLCSHECVPQ